MNEAGGTHGVRTGNLKRRLVSATLARTSLSAEPGVGDRTFTAVVRGLAGVLDVWIGVGGYQVDDDTNGNGLPAALWPAAAGTIQITPQSNFPDRPKIPFRPVFQNPTSLTPHSNDPLPQQLPYSYNMPGECDEAIVTVVLAQAAWVGSGLGDVRIDLQVMVEYNGAWWDAEAIELALGQVQLSAPGGQPLVLASS